MLDQSFAGLCRRMQGKSITRGWDAIVTMNRTKVNALLEQQYIARFDKNSFMAKISGEHPIDSAGYAVLDLSGLLLSQPRLSFENATLANSRARLTFDVEAGTVNQRLDVPDYPSRVTSSFVVTPQQGYKVYADIDLRKTTGIVEKQGRVIIDLGEAVNFTSNLVEGDMAQEALGKFFHQLYASYPPEIRVYELGMLDFDDDDLLVPREFEIRTQKAPGGDDVLSDSYQDGAVVLFVRTRNNPSNGSLPVDESQFEYHIPDDRHPVTGEALYSGSLVLASRVVFDWFVAPHLMNAVSSHLRLQPDVPSNDVARSLRAVAGGFYLADFIHKHTWPGTGTKITTAVWNDGPFTIPFYNQEVGKALRFSASADHMFECSWRGNQPIPLWFEDRNLWGIGDKSYGYSGFAKPVLNIKFKPVVNTSDDTVSFERSDYQYSFTGEWLAPDYPSSTPTWIFNRTGELLTAEVERNMQTFKSMALPGINVFHLNHLLFPEQNALLLTEAALPGDLFLVGHIDPKHTAFTLEPLFGRVKTGETLKFEVKQLALQTQAVTWSVRGIDGSHSTGEISDDGTFTAPDAGLMEGLAVRNVITASYRDVETGELREASALVVIVVEPMTVTPSMLTLDVNHAAPVALKASVLKDEALRWTLHGPGQLDAAGYNATYTPPTTINEPLVPIEIEVTGLVSGNSVLASIVLLKGTFILPVQPGFHPGLPAKSSMQLRVADDEVEPDKIVWRVVAGEGTVDPNTGEYKAPDQIRSPYAVVQATLGSGAFAHKGYGIIHLSDYARAPRWNKLQSFTLTTDSRSPRVLSNGMQQVNVVVEVKPESAPDGSPVEISDKEWESIRLVTKSRTPLKQVGKDGVPPEPKDSGIAWDPWGYNTIKNEFRQYQGAAGEPSAAGEGRLQNGRSRTFYVQTRAGTKLEIAAYLQGDNDLPYYSNGNGGTVEDKRLIEITPIPPTNYADSLYTMTRDHVVGGGRYDDNLDTLDYYTLKLELHDTLIQLKTIEFESAKSIVQWESRQFEEGVCSFAGYALAGSNALNFDPLLYARMPDPPAPGEGEVDKRIRPEKVLKPGYSCPEGMLLISLHRCQYWNFDLGCEPDYTSGLKLRFHDIDGNRHAVKINFKSNTDRNELVAQKDS